MINFLLLTEKFSVLNFSIFFVQKQTRVRAWNDPEEYSRIAPESPEDLKSGRRRQRSFRGVN